MTQKFCHGCQWLIKPENAGIGGGAMERFGRCRIANRIIRRMDHCPLDLSLLKCRCGSDGVPRMHAHSAGYRMYCLECKKSTSIVAFPADARHEWNLMIQGGLK